MSTEGNVYALIAAVSDEIAKTGISKDRKNAQQGYQFRGIDDVYNALAPILARHRLVIVPRFLSRQCVERESKNGGLLFNVTVEGEFDFISAVDGSKHTARTFGEAMDSADKATNKAMSAAYKYAAFQAFCIPTEGDNDADAHSPEVGRAPQSRHEEPPADDAHHSEDGVRVVDVKAAKTGTNNRGPWTLWVVKLSDNREGKTFDDGIATTARRASSEGRSVLVKINNKSEIVSFDFAA